MIGVMILSFLVGLIVLRLVVYSNTAYVTLLGEVLVIATAISFGLVNLVVGIILAIGFTLAVLWADQKGILA